MKSRIRCLAALLSLAALLGCEEPGDAVLAITSKGSVVGFAFLDRNGDGASTPNVDVRFPRLRVSLQSGAGTVATTTTDSLGFFRVADLPVGTYRLTVDESTIGDTVTVVAVDSARLTVLPNDSTSARITLGYSTSKARLIATLPKGRRIAYTGIALNTWSAFGDSTVHLADSTGAIRVVGFRPADIDAGDRVRVVGTVGERDSHVALVDPTVISIGPGEILPPALLSTAQAAAPSDSVKAAHVRIRSAVVLDGASLPGGDVLLTVDDASGPLEVLLDVNAGINTALPITRGAELDVSGVLVPLEGSPIRWRLKPRRTSDVTVTYPVVPISTARAKQPGQYTLVHGIVLNDIGTFGNNTLHLRDASGAIRVLARPGFVSAGDSVSVLGRVSILDGQPALVDGVASVFARRTVPPPVEVTPLRAANADNGALDATLVRVGNVTVRDTATLSGGYRLMIGDEAGTVEVLLDRNAFGVFTPPAMGTAVTITGLLVPANSGGRWLIKPRNSSDITVR